MAGASDSEVEWAGQFRLLPGETVTAALDRYDSVARRTDALVSSLSDLDLAHPLPPAPWVRARCQPVGASGVPAHHR